MPFYIAIDGDNVGQKIEYFIVTNQAQELAAFSRKYCKTMVWLETTLRANLNADIVFMGGDSLLALCSNISLVPINELELIKSQFSQLSEMTFSAGIGSSLRQAYFALKLAKAKGRDRIELFKELPQ
jgi:GTP cyclohydrolase III